MVDERTLTEALDAALDETTAEALGIAPDRPPMRLDARYEGKVRDNYSFGESSLGRGRLLVATDRISAFDRVLGTLPFKGQVLNRLSTFWFDATAAECPNHMIRAVDAQAVFAKECKPLAVELVVRAYLTGVTSTSVWTAYQRGERTFCGHALPEGLKKNEPLPRPLVTPSTKAEKGGHDQSVSRAELLASGVVSEAHFDRAAEMALKLFAAGQAHCAKQGLILVDTKYEMGLDDAGQVVVIDEVHTPDSSRFWQAASYEGRLSRGEEPESFDKEFLRRWLFERDFSGEGPVPPLTREIRVEAARRYIAAYEQIVGAPFVPELEPPLPRLRTAIARTLG
jgi:phosphoribosylaminoimidazole-succinocarboxamide synthase